MTRTGTDNKETRETLEKLRIVNLNLPLVCCWLAKFKTLYGEEKSTNTYLGKSLIICIENV